jgi:flagellar hook-basal body complex protein FliE
MTADFAVGKTDNIHQVMIAAEKAKIAVNLTTAVQSKAIDAYKEIMRLQV